MCTCIHLSLLDATFLIACMFTIPQKVYCSDICRYYLKSILLSITFKGDGNPDITMFYMEDLNKPCILKPVSNHLDGEERAGCFA